MALTTQEKQALQTWLQNNVYKAVRTDWYREGIKDGNGKPVYGPCDRLDANGQPTGETYYGRTFIVRTRQAFDWHEVVYRTWRKATKLGYSVDYDQVERFLAQYKDTIKTWAGIASVVQGISLPDTDLDAEEPDA